MIRNARRDDLHAVVAVMNAVDVATLGQPDTTQSDIARGWDETGFELEADAFVTDEGGQVVGYAELYAREETVFDLDVYVHPDQGDEVGASLLDAALERAATRAAPGSVLATWLPVGDRRLLAYAGVGFTPVRRFVRMRHESDGIGAAAQPDGIVLRAFDPDADAAAVHAVLVDAFSSHVRPMTPSLDTFTEQHLDHPDFDARYWVVAEDGGEVVGAISAFNHGDIGFIRHVGVRASRRGRGIGAALVLESLRRLAAAGQHRVDLGVDTQDDVGAARLYEGLGFSTIQQLELVERRL